MFKTLSSQSLEYIVEGLASTAKRDPSLALSSLEELVQVPKFSIAVRMAMAKKHFKPQLQGVVGVLEQAGLPAGPGVKEAFMLHKL